MAEKRFNEELCEQVRQGKLAIENTDNEKEIEDLLAYIFPRDEFSVPDSRFFFVNPSNTDYYADDSISFLPTKSVSDFFKPAPTQPQDSPDELEREAKELIKIFSGVEWNKGKIYQELKAKECALIHCNLMIETLKSIFRQDEDKQSDIVYFTKLKTKINSL